MPFIFPMETNSMMLRLQPRCIARLIVVCLAVSTVAPAWADVEPTPRSEVSRLNADQMNSLNEVLYRQRRLQVQLVRVIDEFREGETTAALGQFQQLLDASGDSFLWTSNGTLTSVLQTLDKLMDGQKPVVWRNYEKMFGEQAARLLRRGRTQRNSAVIADVARRFFHTRAGFDAVSLQASWWFDHGEIAAAAACYRRLLDSRVHRARWNDPLRLRAALVFHWAQQPEQSRRLLAEISAETCCRRWTSRCAGTMAAEARGRPRNHAPHLRLVVAAGNRSAIWNRRGEHAVRPSSLAVPVDVTRRSRCRGIHGKPGEVGTGSGKHFIAVSGGTFRNQPGLARVCPRPARHHCFG